MGINLGGTVRRATIAAALALAVTAGPAAATSPVIGPETISVASSMTDAFVVLNTTAPGGSPYAAPTDGRITAWSGNFDCTDGCGEAKLLVLSSTGGYHAVEESDWETPVNPGGVQTFLTDLPIQEDETVALAFRDGGKVRIVSSAGEFVGLDTAYVGGTIVFNTPGGMAESAAYNASFLPKVPTVTSVDAAPNPVVVDNTVTYTTEVIAGGLGSVTPADVSLTGTVSLTLDGNPIANCQSVPLVNGSATCTGPAGSVPAYRSVLAEYSGDEYFEPSDGDDGLRVIAPATVAATVAPNPVQRLAPIVYKAHIGGFNPTSFGLNIYDYGTVAFFVDGEPITLCATQPVDELGKATCPSFAPPVGGDHVLKTVYSGNYFAGTNWAEAPFVVLAPAATLPETVDFASVAVGSTTTRTVTVTNSGTGDLHVAHAAVSEGPFTITGDGCAGKTLAGGESCGITVAFGAGSVGSFRAKLSVSHDGLGREGVTLTGTGAAAPAPPTPAPPVPPKAPGATLAPGAKSTLTVTIPTSGSNANASSAPVLSLPLSCPANDECMLDGRLTIDQSSITGKARAAAADSKTVARFSRVQVEAGGLKTIKLKLSPEFVKSAQKRGIRRIKATLTVNTVLGSGQRITTQQRVTVLLPKAAKKKKAAQKVRPRFTG